MLSNFSLSKLSDTLVIIPPTASGSSGKTASSLTLYLLLKSSVVSVAKTELFTSIAFELLAETTFATSKLLKFAKQTNIKLKINNNNFLCLSIYYLFKIIISKT